MVAGLPQFGQLSLVYLLSRPMAWRKRTTRPPRITSHRRSIAVRCQDLNPQVVCSRCVLELE
jgi:hypothetical protein